MLNSFRLAAYLFFVSWVVNLMQWTVGLEEYVCGGVDMRNSPEAFFQTSLAVRREVTSCTVIEGDVHFILMVNDNMTDRVFDSVSFPKLREITGHLMLFQVKALTSLAKVFPELRVIRGETLIHNYAFVMYQNADIVEIGLPKLTEISKGGVRIFQNPNLCYADTINWREISKETPFIEHNKQPNMCFDRCKPMPYSNRTKKGSNFRGSPDDDTVLDGCARRSEPFSNMTACWNADTCQRTCPAECKSKGLACSDIGPRPICCDKECIGGCSGPGDENCYACRVVYHKNRCLPACPIGYYKYKGRRCITEKECQSKESSDNSYTDDIYYKPINKTGVCSLTCPPGYEEDPVDVRTCRVCPLGVGCTKKCRSHTSIQSVSDAQHFKGCNVLVGSLDIEIHSGMSRNIVQTLEEYLRDLREVTEYVKISFTPSFVALDFLKNLRLIRGKSLYRDRYALSILGNVNLARLWDPGSLNDSDQLLTIQRGSVQFHNNRQLCYSMIVDFLNLLNMSENFTEHDVSKNSNGERAICEKNKLELTISSTTFNTIVYRLKPFNTSSMDQRLLLGYQVYYKAVESEVTNIYEKRDACSDSWQMNFLPPNEANEGGILAHLKPYQLYAIYARTLTVDSAGSGAISDVQYAKTTFKAPSVAVLKSAKSVRPDAIELAWDPPVSPNGQVTHYKLTYGAKVDYLPKERDYCIEPPDYGKVSDDSADEDSSTVEPIDDATVGTCLKSCINEIKSKIETNSERSRIAREKANFEDAVHNAILRNSPMDIKQRMVVGGRRKRLIREHLDQVTKRESSLFDADFSPNISERENLAFLVAPPTESPYFTSHFGLYTKSDNSELGPEDSKTFNVSTLNVTLTNLTHFTMYEIKVWACQNVSVASSSCSELPSYRSQRTLTIEEKDTIDTKSVRIFDEPSPENGPQKRITWKPPQDPNGFVVSYEVEYWRDASPKIAPKIECVPATRFNASVGVLLTDLLPGNYSVRVRAVTLAQRAPQTGALYFLIAQPFRMSTTQVVLVAFFCSVLFLTFGFLLPGALYRRWIRKKYPEYLMGIFSANPDYISQIEMYRPDEWELNRDSIRLFDEIGKGSFGTVFKGRGVDVRSVCGVRFGDCAVKTVAKTATLYDRFHFLAEAAVMKSMRTQHVVKLYGVVSETQPVLVVMEYMAEGNLREHLIKRRPDSSLEDLYEPPSLQEVLRMACQVADGMAYLAARKFCHRDLAARNCMVAADGTVKIGDFGMTRDVQTKDYYKPCGRRLIPVRWMPPEALQYARFTTQSDVWSYGIVLWEIVTLANQPYQGLSNEGVRKFVVEDRGVMKMPRDCPDQLWDLMLRCWQYNPAHRPDFDTVVSELLPCMQGTSFDQVSYYHTQRGADLGAYDASLTTAVQKSADGSTAASATPPPTANGTTSSDKDGGGKAKKSRRQGLKIGWFERYVICFYPSSSLFQQHMQQFEGANDVGFVDSEETPNDPAPNAPLSSQSQKLPTRRVHWSTGVWLRLASLLGRQTRRRPPSPVKVRNFGHCNGVGDKAAADHGALLPAAHVLDRV